METVRNGTHGITPGSRQPAGRLPATRAALLALAAAVLSCDDGATGLDNAPPAALDVTVEVARGLPVTFTVAATDPDGDPLVYEVLTSPRRGELTLAQGTAGAEATYTPDPDFLGVDVFTYRVSDGDVSAVGTVMLDVAARSPELGSTPGEAARPAAGGPVTIRLMATDPDGDPATFEITTPPAHGAVSAVVIVSTAGAGPASRAASDGTTTVGELTYTPDGSHEGEDTFGFRASDGTWTSPERFVRITLNGVPEAFDREADTGKGDAVRIVLSGVDPDGDALEFQVVEPPAHGTVVIEGAAGSAGAGAPSSSSATAVYTPTPGYAGPDAFTFLVSDGLDVSAPAHVALNVVNGPPVAEGGEAAVAKNHSIELTLRGSDPDGDPLTFEIARGPANGTLTEPAGAASGASAAGTPGSSAEGPSPAANGVSGLEAPPASSSTAVFVYTPDPGVSGPDAFTFRVSDGEDESEPAAFEVTVTNVAPSAVPPAPAEVAAGGEVTLALSGFDPDGDPLTFEVSSPPAEGLVVSVTPTGPASADLVYRAGATSALRTFEVVASDGTDAGPPVTIEVRVDGPPTAAGQAVSTDEDAPLGITLTGSDPEGTDLTFEIVAPPAHGALGPLTPAGAPVAQAVLTYSPAAGYGGPDGFTFRVTDAFGLPGEATVSITVEPVNDVPTADDDAYATDEDVALVVAAPGVLDDDTDPDGDALSAVLEDGPDNGTLSLSPDGSFTYTPNANFNGSDAFTYRASDGVATSAVATVDLTVSPVTDATTLVVGSPTGQYSDQVSLTTTLTAGGAPVSGREVVFEVDGVVASVAITDASGTAVVTHPIGLPSGLYTVAAAFAGDAEHLASAGSGVLAVIHEDATIAYTGDTNAYGGPFTLRAALTQAADGSAGAMDLAGVVEFRLRHADGSVAGTHVATVRPDGNVIFSLGILPARDYDVEVALLPNDYYAAPGIVAAIAGPPPTATGDAYTANENVTLTVSAPGVLANDTDPDGDPLGAVLETGAENGTVTLNADGSFSYTPDVDFFGTDGFTYRASDGRATSAPATVTLTVARGNDAPTGVADAYATDENVTLSVAAPGVLANDLDPEGDPLTASLESGPANGTLTLAADGSFTYVPNPDFNGPDPFTYRASDGAATSVPVTVTIDVHPVGSGELHLHSGNSQTVPVGDPSQPLVVELRDVLGFVIPDAEIRWTVLENATLESATTTTDAEGRSSNVVRITAEGAARVEARSDQSANTVVFELTGSVANVPDLGPLGTPPGPGGGGDHAHDVRDVSLDGEGTPRR